MVHKITHRQLEVFAALIETGKVTNAAGQIGITQPSASRLISDLEYTIGFDLFVREKRRLSPTMEALALYEEVERSFVGLNKITDIANDIRQYRRGSLMIAGMPALALKFLPDVVAKFAHSNPNISISLQARSSQVVNQQVASQQLDLGFATPEADHPAVNKELLFEAPLVAVLPPNHGLCSKQILAPQDFENQLFISLGAAISTRSEIDAIFLTAGVSRRTQIETQLSSSACEIVSKGQFCTVTEPMTALDFADRGEVIIKPFSPQQMFQYYILQPANKTPSLVANRFLEIVSTNIEKRLQSLLT